MLENDLLHPATASSLGIKLLWIHLVTWPTELSVLGCSDVEYILWSTLVLVYTEIMSEFLYTCDVQFL